MLSDSELDLEDLEARLYGQVYHSSQDEVESSCPPEIDLSSTMRPTNRYFQNSPNTYQRQKPNNGYSNEHLNQQHRYMQNQHNLMNSIANYAIPPVLMNPVNNIVVIPPAPTQIFTQQVKTGNRNPRKQRKRKKWLERVKKWQKEKAAQKRNNSTKEASPQKTKVTNNKEQPKHNIIQISDSDEDSDACVEVPNVAPVIEVLSDNECESINEIKTSSLKNESPVKIIRNDLNTDTNVVHSSQQKQCSELIYLEDELDKTVVDDKTNFVGSSSSQADVSGNSDLNKSDEIIKIRECTPESNASNDFLDNSVELSQNKFNFSLHGSDFNTKELTKTNSKNAFEHYETESSASDLSAPVKTAVFNEIPFESPAKDIFTEGNLETFREFITPKRPAVVASTPDSKTKASSKKKTLVKKSLPSSSEESSSSESDYEDKSKNKVNTTLPTLSTFSSISEKTNSANSESDEEMHSSLKAPQIQSFSAHHIYFSDSSDSDDENNSFLQESKAETEYKETSQNSSALGSATESSKNTTDTHMEEQVSSKEIYDSESTKHKPKKKKKNHENSEVSNLKENITSGEMITSEIKTLLKRKSMDLQNDTNNELEKNKDEENKNSNNGTTIDSCEDSIAKKKRKISSNVVQTNEQNSERDAVAISSDSDVEEIKENISVRSISTDDESCISVHFDFSDFDNVGGDVTLANCSKSSVRVKTERSEPYKKITFEDYWSENQEKFYMETKGLENFSVSQALSNMPDDPEKWKIVDSDKYLIPRNPMNGRRCNRCREIGHMAVRCKNKPCPSKCRLCGIRGHLEPRCPNKMCTLCGRYGDYSTNFCRDCMRYRNRKCRTCKMYGHPPNRCPDLWRRYILTTEEGPLVRPKGIPIKEAKDLYCSGCAKQGHLEHTCDYYNRTHPPTTPVICEFKDVYNKESSPNKTGPIQEHQQAQRPQNMQQPVQQRQHVHEPRFTQETELNNFSFIQNFQKMQNQENRNVFVPLMQSLPNINFMPYMRPNPAFINMQQNFPQLNQPMYNVPLTPYQQNASHSQQNRQRDFDTSHNFIALNAQQQPVQNRLGPKEHPLPSKAVTLRFLLENNLNRMKTIKRSIPYPQKLQKTIKNLENRLQRIHPNDSSYEGVRVQLAKQQKYVNMLLYGFFGFKGGSKHLDNLYDHLFYLNSVYDMETVIPEAMASIQGSFRCIFSDKLRNEERSMLMEVCQSNYLCSIYKSKRSFMECINNDYKQFQNHPQQKRKKLNVLYQKISSCNYTIKDVCLFGQAIQSFKMRK